jgi:flagella basal body P-ring formation protein FlgA
MKTKAILVLFALAVMCRAEDTPAMPQEKRVLDALRSGVEEAGWRADEVAIQLVDYSKAIEQSGSLRFPPSQLVRQMANGKELPATWRGTITTQEGRSNPIWVKVQVWTDRQGVVAVRPIAPGKKISDDDVVINHWNARPWDPPPLQSTADVVGRFTRRSLAAGIPIEASSLAAPYDISRGDTVHVEVRNGGAVLLLDTHAESDARTGGTVLLRNPANGRRFAGWVTGKGQALVSKDKPGERVNVAQ